MIKRIISFGLLILVLVIVSGLIFQSVILARVVLPLLAQSSGLRFTTAQHSLNFLSGGTLKQVVFTAEEFELSADEVHIMWSVNLGGWRNKKVTITDGQLRLTFLENVSVHKMDHTVSNSIAGQIMGNSSWLLPDRIELKRLQILKFKLIRRPDTEITLTISEANMILGEDYNPFVFSISGDLSVGEVFSLTSFSKIVGVISPDGSWSGKVLNSEISLPVLQSLSSADANLKLTGSVHGKGLGLFDFVGDLVLDNQDFGKILIALSPDPPANTGLLKWQHNLNSAALRKLFPFLEKLLEEDGILTNQGDFSWSQDESEFHFNAKINEQSLVDLLISRTGSQPWLLQHFSLNLENNLLQATGKAHSQSAPLREAKLVVSGKIHRPEVLRQFLPAHLIVDFEAPFIFESLFRMQRRYALSILLDVFLTNLSVSLQQIVISKPKVKINTEMQLDFPRGFRIAHVGAETPEGHLFNYNPNSKVASGSNMMFFKKFGDVTTPFLKLDTFHLTLIPEGGFRLNATGCDAPNSDSWLSPSSNANPEKWELIFDYFQSHSTTQPRVIVNVNLPESQGALNYSADWDPEVGTTHQLTALGVDFSKITSLSELGLGYLVEIAKSSTDFELNLEVEDSDIPRLGKGDVKVKAKKSDTLMHVQSCDITLENGGLSAAGVLHVSKESFQPHDLNVALKSIELPAFKNLVPQEISPYMTGLLTLNFEYHHPVGISNPTGRGSAEWFDANIDSIPPIKQLLSDAGQRFSIPFEAINLESGNAQFEFSDNTLHAKEIFITGARGMIEASAQYQVANDRLMAEITLHLETNLLRRSRFRLGNTVIGGQTIVTFGRQQDDFTTLPGILPLRGNLLNKVRIEPDWQAWLKSAGLNQRPQNR